ncbi:hypothetical protein DM75_5224 [Burkholderia mallei]|nr:hypothetical protein DM75_5224 [Burkholderia mallei]
MRCDRRAAGAGKDRPRGLLAGVRLLRSAARRRRGLVAPAA